jgi:hypothetical protein
MARSERCNQCFRLVGQTFGAYQRCLFCTLYFVHAVIRSNPERAESDLKHLLSDLEARRDADDFRDRLP